MADRVRVRVVEVEAMAEHRVGEGGVRAGHALFLADDDRITDAAELAHCRATFGGDFHRARSEAASVRVEQVVLGVLDDIARDGVVAKRCGEFGELFGCRSHLLLLLALRASVPVPAAPRRLI